MKFSVKYNETRWEGYTILTYLDFDRGFWIGEPWIAHLDDYDGAPIDNETASTCPIASGATEQEAIENLKEQLL